MYHWNTLTGRATKVQEFREAEQPERRNRRSIMILPLQITFRGMAPSPALEARIRVLASRLERFSDHIRRCHVIVQTLAHHERHGFLYDFRIDITVPEGEIAIRHAHPADRSHEDPYVALRDAFRAARRKLEDYERKRRHQVKSRSQPVHGRITPGEAHARSLSSNAATPPIAKT
jgi:ribosome-associated translation inhibitor RaiA